MLFHTGIVHTRKLYKGYVYFYSAFPLHNKKHLILMCCDLEMTENEKVMIHKFISQEVA